ncbi:MAG: hypothetical protein M5U26_17215 [Planctomycetota bacterium]|nr:hypothetical protein [Planctomycetota bacterium]
MVCKQRATLSLAALGLFLAGCAVGPDKEKTDEKVGEKTSAGDRMKEEVREAWDATSDFAGEEYDEVIGAAKERLKELKRKVDELKPSIEDSKAHAKAQYERIIAELKLGIQRLDDRIAYVQASTQDEWTAFRAHLKEALHDLDDLYNAALEAMQADEPMKTPDAPEGEAKKTPGIL